MDERFDTSPTGSGGLLSEEHSEKKRYCLNCETELMDSYCPHCGQKDIPKRQTLRELFTNFILLRPGFLAIEYNSGRRERYFHPARMYVFISFIYFLLLYSLPDVGDQETVVSSSENLAYEGYGTTLSIDKIGVTSFSRYDSIQKSLPASERDVWVVRFYKKREIEVNQKYFEDPTNFVKNLESSFVGNFPKIFFILLPVFALLLKLLYLRKDFFYSEHLVFSIYYYNFFFLAGSLYMLFTLSDWTQWLAVCIGIWIALHLLIGMKRMYKQTWGKTVIKYATLSLLFTVCVFAGLLLNLMITLMYI